MLSPGLTNTHTHTLLSLGRIQRLQGCADQACSSLSRFSSCNWMRMFRLFTTSTSCLRISCSAFSSSGVFRVSVGAGVQVELGRPQALTCSLHHAQGSSPWTCWHSPSLFM